MFFLLFGICSANSLPTLVKYLQKPFEIAVRPVSRFPLILKESVIPVLSLVLPIRVLITPPCFLYIILVLLQ